MNKPKLEGTAKYCASILYSLDKLINEKLHDMNNYIKEIPPVVVSIKDLKNEKAIYRDIKKQLESLRNDIEKSLK